MRSEPFVSYAQNGEDVVLARALRPDQRSGFWIDVGAGDPVQLSVTAAFSERGWRGINIEPLPPEYEQLCAARPNDVNLQVALGAAPGNGRLYAGPVENRGSSTLDRELVDRYVAQGQTFEPLEVRITTLAEVVAEHAPEVIDFLKVDVEGFEYEVLTGADWSSFHPRVILVEATEPNTDRCNHELWEPMLVAQGYRCALFDGLNRFYASADEPALFEALSVPANVHDNFIPQAWVNIVHPLMRAVHEAEANARRYHDHLAIALDEVDALRNDLDAAQRFNAQALSDLEAAQGAVEREHAELAALLNTKLYRYTAPLRRLRGRLERRPRGSTDD